MPDMQLTVGTQYEVTETLTTPVVDGHEIGGIWSEHASVQLDPGERFKVTHDTGGDGWYIARMSHPLRFNVGTVGEITWQGSFHIHTRDLEKLRVWDGKSWTETYSKMEDFEEFQDHDTSMNH